MKKTLLSFAFCGTLLTSFAQTYSFTNAGAIGQNGPTQLEIDAAYTATNLAGAVMITTQGIQEWTVPATGMYQINAIGACGGELQGTYYPGLPGTGASIQGEFMLTAGTVLYIVVGQKGMYGDNGSGGGGGSFVFTGTPAGGGLMIAAGGGGGHGHGSSGVGTGALGGGGSADQNQVDGMFGTGNGGNAGVGMGGNSGVGCSYSGIGAGGTGWYASGQNGLCGMSTGGNNLTFVGGNGGSDGLFGGFGGGGGSDGNGSPGGGGGGFTGGGGGNDFDGSAWGAGAGAGSYNSGANSINTAGITGAASGFSHGSVTITLICSNPDNGVTLNVTTLTSDEISGSASYQWIDCDNGNMEIAGETNISYTPTLTGNYAVVVDLNGCSDTSACMLVDFSGIEELNNIKFNIYPNPGSGVFNLKFAEESDYNVVVYDLSGKMVFNNQLNSSTGEIDLSALMHGVYHVSVMNDGKVSTKKLILL